MFLTFHAIDEASPGPKWQRSFERFWPSYERWFLSEGHRNRAGYVTSKRMLATHMPELVPVYEELVELAGGGDIAARFLSLYRPPPYLAGCTQAIWTGHLANQDASGPLHGSPGHALDGTSDAPAARHRHGPQLVRNYDFSPELFEGTVLRSAWLRPVIATTDCVWGALDGVNDAGLVAALAFGGRRVTGDGFGIPLIIRYLLETCASVAEGIAALQRVPSHMAYTVMLLDARGAWSTVFLAPDRAPVVTDARACTNHQQRIDWPDYVAATGSVERLAKVQSLLDTANDPPELARAFLHEPLYGTKYHRGFGTLYTGRYEPVARRMTLTWPRERALSLAIGAFREQTRVVDLRPSHLTSLVE